MYYLLIIASQLSLLPFLDSQHVFEVKHSLPWYNRPAMRYTQKTEEECMAKTENVKKHPYYAGILSTCYELINKTKVPISTQRFGFIVSREYVLSPLDQSMFTEMGCDNYVQILAGDSTYKAKLVKKSSYAFYKLDTPITFGPQARPVEIIDLHDEPRPGEQATIVGLNYNKSTDEFGVIQLANVTLINDRDTKRMLLHFRHAILFGDFIWFNYREQPCLYNVLFTFMFVGNRLVGIDGTPVFDYNGRRVQGYYSLAQYKSKITKLTSD